jgi:hypothetical protein
MWPVFAVLAAVDTEHVLEIAAAEDEDSVEALGAERADPALGVSVRLGAWTGVRITLMPSVRKTSSKAWLNFLSRSWTSNRNGCSSPNCMIRLRACWATQPPSGFDVQATYSIRRVASEMKKRT